MSGRSRPRRSIADGWLARPPESDTSIPTPRVVKKLGCVAPCSAVLSGTSLLARRSHRSTKTVATGAPAGMFSMSGVRRPRRTIADRRLARVPESLSTIAKPSGTRGLLARQCDARLKKPVSGARARTFFMSGHSRPRRNIADGRLARPRPREPSDRCRASGVTQASSRSPSAGASAPSSIAIAAAAASRVG
jgi:hypothetical protein